LSNVDKLTALADYKLPIFLRDEGILEYSVELAEIIDNKLEIPAKSEYEIELRACTIWAVEEIKNIFAEMGVQMLSKEINDYIWLASSNAKSNHHRTRTTAY